MKQLRVGMIGAGGIARTHLKYLTSYPDVDVVAATDIAQPNLDRVSDEYGVSRTYTSCEEMLRTEDLDAVSVCTPNGLHAEHTIAALESGCHVLVEKPLAMNAAEGRKMLDAAEKAKKELVIAFQWRYHAKAQFLKHLVDKGRFGNILHMKCSALRRRGIPNWGVFGRKELQGGGPLIDIGVHIMEMAHYVMGAPKPVAASGQTFQYIGNKRSKVKSRWPNWDYKTYTVEDLAIGHIRFDNGAIMQVEASFAGHLRDQWDFTFLGEKGGADFDSLTVHTDQDDYMMDSSPAYLPDVDHFEAKMRAFVDTALKGKKNQSPASDGLIIQKIIDAIYQSAETGHEVTID